MKTALHLCHPSVPDGLHRLFQAEGWREKRVEEGLAGLASLPDKGAEGLWLPHQLPMLQPHETIPTLMDIQRVLKDDGVFLAVVWDGQLAARQIANGKDAIALGQQRGTPLLARDMLYGAHGEYHQCFSAQSLGGALKQAGFQEIQITRDQLHIWAAGVARPTQARAWRDKIRVQDNHKPRGLADYLDVPPTSR
jgi:hypothetical protein